jgi:hypothetical protein
MKRFGASAAIVFALSLPGCGGGGDQGPVDPSQTPQVSEEDIRKSMTQGMPEEAKKRYGITDGAESSKGE